MAVTSAGTIKVGGRQLKIGKLDRVVFPRAGVTKGELLDYYVRLGDTMLPHLRERLLHMHRYPEGVEGPRFWQKGCPEHRPDWMRSRPSGARRSARTSTSAWSTSSLRCCGRSTSARSSCTRRCTRATR